MSKKIPQSFNFDETVIREIPVTYKGVEYVFREPSLGASSRAQNMLSRNQIVNEKGDVVKVENTGDLHVNIVASCLFKKLPDGKEQAVASKELLEWPSRHIKELLSVYAEWNKANNDTAEDLEEELRAVQEKLDKVRSGETEAKN